jgi:diguanylate cyclase (GGDEF)-like protein
VALRRTAWKVVLLGGLAASAIYPLLPGSTIQNIYYSLFGTASVLCILLGIRFLHPNDRASWFLFAAGELCFTLGDDVWSLYTFNHANPPSPSFADLLYLAGYPFLFLGVLKLAPRAKSLFRREVLIDSGIIALGALAIFWFFIMESYVSDQTAGILSKIVNLSYPVMDICLIFVVTSKLLFSASRKPFHVLVMMSIMVMFIADFTYDLMALHSNAGSVGSVDAWFLVQYALIAVAAIHPSVADRNPIADEVVLAEMDELAPLRGRLPVVLLAGLIPPGMLVIAIADGVTTGDLVLAVLCMVVFGVVFLRMGSLVDRVASQARQMKTNEDRLGYLAYHDSLTGLANRALLYRRTNEAIVANSRSGGVVALCLGDLDGFKNVNDTQGHDAGDILLLKTAEYLKSIVRAGDVVARLGGDEFAILMNDVSGAEDAMQFANRIVLAMDQAHKLGGSSEGASISVGIALGGSDTSVEQMVSEADAAMYEAKAAGKGCARLFKPEMRNRLFERFNLINDFRSALEHSEFSLDYQPIFSLSDMRLTGFEALVRWQHPTRGLILPYDFIPLAEETGFILPLGRWILEEACTQLSAWSASTSTPLSLAVNVSRRQLTSPQLLDDIRAVLSITGANAERLILEVTEGMLMDDPIVAEKALVELRTSGIQVAIDDFGTGFSSLGHLHRFPVDLLKIDKVFVDSLDRTQREGSAIASSIIDLARNMGLRVVAEGIEREDQLKVLLELGSDFGQGFWLGVPLDREGTTALIDQHCGVRHAT